MVGYSGNEAVPGGQIGSGEAQVFNPMPTLGILSNVLQREDQKARLAAMERMKAEALKAKAEKPIEYPEFDVKGGGGLFRKLYNEKQAARNLETLAKIRQANGDPYITAREATIRKNEMAGESAILDEQEARVKNATEELRKQGYVVDQDRELFQFLNDKNYLNPELVNDYVKAVKSNPKNFNFAQVGTEAEKLGGMVEKETIKGSGRYEKVSRAKFMRPSKENPYIDEISVQDAVPLLLQTPAGREQFPQMINQSLLKQGLSPTEVDQINSTEYDKLSDVQKNTLIKAQEEAIKPFFQGRGDYKFVENFKTTKKAAEDAASGKALAGYQEVRTPIRINYATKYTDGTSTTTPLDLSGLSVKLPTPSNVGVGKRVFLLGGNQAEIKKLEEAKVIVPQPDGSHIVNFGFTVKEFQKPENVLQLTKDTKFKLRDGSIKTRKAGAFISPFEAQGLRNIKQDDHFKKVKSGYMLSPGSFQTQMNEDEELQKLIGPTFQNMNIFVPGGVGEMPELENMNPRKKPVVETEEIDLGLL